MKKYLRTIVPLLFCSGIPGGVSASDSPNIIFIMSDDQGYGDVSCYNPESKVITPGIDRLAREGMRFTDAHSASSVCTPTRYGLLTGRYPWRSRLQKGVMETGEGSLIAPDVLTVAQFLKQNNYKTALIGKWHLGFNYDMPAGKSMKEITTVLPWDTFKVKAAPISSKVIDGPITLGFDQYSGFHHAREMHSWVENDIVVEEISLVDVLPRITKKSVAYIEKRARKNDGPFFLYVPLGSPHAPVVPSKEWVRKSGLSIYGDFIMETDNAVVEILEALDRTKLAQNTIVIFTADNGCSMTTSGWDGLLSKGHDPSYSLRGVKTDGYDGGHRVPYVVRWPKVITPDSVSDQIICHNNLFATCADILQKELPHGAAPDSFSILPILKNENSGEPTHPFVIHHTARGMFAIRKGDWKFLAFEGSGGRIKGGDGKKSQLYRIDSDRKESVNLINKYPEKAKELLRLLEKSIADGRTSSGISLQNDVPVEIWKDYNWTKKNK